MDDEILSTNKRVDGTCPYCTDGDEDYIISNHNGLSTWICDYGLDTHSLIVFNNKQRLMSEVYIHYCPICGRKLDINKRIRLDYKELAQQLVDELSEKASSNITVFEKDGTARPYRTDELQEDLLDLADKYQEFIDWDKE